VSYPKTAAVGVRIFHISKVCPQLKETFFVKEARLIKARSCTDWVERDFFNTGGVKGRTEFEYICSICGAPPEDSPLVADAVLGLHDGRKLLPCCEDCHAAKKKPVWKGRPAHGAGGQACAQGGGADGERGQTAPARGRGRGRGRGRAGLRRGQLPDSLRTRTRRWAVLARHPRAFPPRAQREGGSDDD